MTEGISMSPEDAAAARAAEQARLRKERREAKLKAGGASRLNKISGLVGGLPKEEPAATTTQQPQPQPSTKPQPAPAAHADPDEVDISEHFYQPRSTPRVPPPQQQQQQSPFNAAGTGDNNNPLSEDALRQMMLGFDAPGGGPGAGSPDDMFMQMMMQSLGGGGGGGGQFPPGGAGNPFASMMPSFPPPGGQAAEAAAVALPDSYAALWRLLHTAVALGLGLYIALWTSFSGTKTDRDLSRDRDGKNADGGQQVILVEGGVNAEMARRFFWAFATAEALLLTTRFFMDRWRAPPQGLLGTVVGFLPGRVGRYVKVGLQYGQIFSTVKADILVCVFVLGACSWLRS